MTDKLPHDPSSNSKPDSPEAGERSGKGIGKAVLKIGAALLAVVAVLGRYGDDVVKHVPEMIRVLFRNGDEVVQAAGDGWKRVRNAADHVDDARRHSRRKIDKYVDPADTAEALSRAVSGRAREGASRQSWSAKTLAQGKHLDLDTANRACTESTDFVKKLLRDMELAKEPKTGEATLSVLVNQADEASAVARPASRLHPPRAPPGSAPSASAAGQALTPTTTGRGVRPALAGSLSDDLPAFQDVPSMEEIAEVRSVAAQQGDQWRECLGRCSLPVGRRTLKIVGEMRNSRSDAASDPHLAEGNRSAVRQEFLELLKERDSIRALADEAFGLRAVEAELDRDDGRWIECDVAKLRPPVRPLVRALQLLDDAASKSPQAGDVPEGRSAELQKHLKKCMQWIADVDLAADPDHLRSQIEQRVEVLVRERLIEIAIQTMVFEIKAGCLAELAAIYQDDLRSAGR